MYLCYSSCQVDEMVNALCCHLQDWGIPLANVCEKGYREMLHESNTYELNATIKRHKYALIVLSHCLLHDTPALIELDVLKKQFEKKEMRVFVLTKDVQGIDIPYRVSWIRNLEIVRIENNTDIQNAVCEMVRIILHDDMKSVGAEIMRKVIQEKTSENGYIQRIFNEYSHLNAEDDMVKITMLFTLYHYVESCCHSNSIYDMYKTCIIKVFHENSLYNKDSMRRVQIAESSVALIMYRIITETEYGNHAMLSS